MRTMTSLKHQLTNRKTMKMMNRRNSRNTHLVAAAATMTLTNLLFVEAAVELVLLAAVTNLNITN
jgi:hypothetical protein